MTNIIPQRSREFVIRVTIPVHISTPIFFFERAKTLKYGITYTNRLSPVLTAVIQY